MDRKKGREEGGNEGQKEKIMDRKKKERKEGRTQGINEEKKKETNKRIMKNN